MRPTNTAPNVTPTAKTTTQAPAQSNAGPRPFPVSNNNAGNTSHSDQIRAALDTLGIKLIKSEAERDVLKKLVEETRQSQLRLERELQENRKELSETRKKIDDTSKESELSKSRQERLEEKLREAQANNVKISRKLEVDEQKRMRMQRRMDRLETIAEEAQGALQSRAMVLLTDHTTAEKSGLPMITATGAMPAALPAPGRATFIGSEPATVLSDEEPMPWYQKPLNLNTSVAMIAVVVALGFGFMAASMNDNQNAVAFMADGSLARIDLKNGTLQPLQLQLKKLDETPAATETPNVSEKGEPLPQAKPAQAAATATTTATPSSAPAKDTSLTGTLKDLQDKAYAGIAEAQHDLAAVYTAGSGVKQDYKRAAYWFQQAASAGVANAAYNLGVLNHQGLGMSKDITRALDWYRVAALQGHPEAQYNLGIAYIEGIGTKYNPQLAAGFFQKAALAGITEAAYNLGLILENGLLAEPKPNQALMWYRVGSEGGSAEAKNALEQLANRLGLSPDKAGFLPDGTSLSKLVVRPDRADANTTSATASKELAKLLPDLAEMIPDSDQLLIAQTQEQLTRREMYDGPEDGALSSKTGKAIEDYQESVSLKADGKPSSDLLMRMLKDSVAADAAN